MSTSPVGVLRVVNEQRSSGQATERVLHLVALNSVLAVLTFKVIVGFWVFNTSGSLTQAISHSALELILSALIGAISGMLVPAVLRHLGNLAREGTLAFALVVVILVAITYSSGLSPVLATLAFGLTARHRRVTFTRTQRNFGAIGELLTILLFVFAVSTLSWSNVVNGGLLAFVLLLARFAVKTAGVAAFSHLSGITWRKGLASGMALAPMSVFVVLLLEQTKNAGVVLIDELAAVAAMTLFMEVIGPIITQRALIWARETTKE